MKAIDIDGRQYCLPVNENYDRADEAVLFYRYWWNGEVIDVLAVTKEFNATAQLYCGCIAMEPNQFGAKNITVFSGGMKESQFQQFKSSCIQFGIEEMQSQDDNVILTHYDLIMFVKNKGKHNCFYTRCGKRKIPKENQLGEFLLQQEHFSKLPKNY